MEKEKMIQEMAMLLCKDICFRKLCSVTNHCQIKNCKMREKATLLYYFIVKKYNDFIPEGAVVLTKEEYEKYKHFKEYNAKDKIAIRVSSHQDGVEQARKETIKKVAHYLDNEKGFCGLGYMTAKHFGVEVEE